MTKLKPCPFCGEETELKLDGCCVSCAKCVFNGYFSGGIDEEDTVKAWNTRTDPPEDHRLRVAIQHAINIFDCYAQLHLNKVPPDTEKAQPLAERAKFLRGVLDGTEET